MNSKSLPETPAISKPATPRYAGPIWTLLILAPVIAEVLSGSTRISFMFVLIPEIMVWGVGALLCRELVRRWHAGGPSLLLLGLALSVAEECVIQQTSLAPLPFPGANIGYGRSWGVNWLYFLFMLGFESVWVVLVPVQVTELIFPVCRDQPWLRKRGIIASCFVFVLGSFIAWYSWTQQALPRMLHIPPYNPPLATIAIAVAVIALLVLAAFLLRSFGHAAKYDTREPVVVWVAGVTSFVMGGAWFSLIVLVFAPHPNLPLWTTLSVGVAWALFAFAVIQRLSSSQRWSDAHRWCLSFGATLACMAVSYISNAGWSQSDLVGKVILNILATAGFLVLARHVWQRRSRQAPGA